jgi:hypothetical protein
MRVKAIIKKYRLPIVMLLIVLGIIGCALQLEPVKDEAPGFIYGLVHGFCNLMSFIASLFTDVRIYAFPNAGSWHDFGFLIGAAVFLGGGGAGAK